MKISISGVILMVSVVLFGAFSGPFSGIARADSGSVCEAVATCIGPYGNFYEVSCYVTSGVVGPYGSFSECSWTAIPNVGVTCTGLNSAGEWGTFRVGCY